VGAAPPTPLSHSPLGEARRGCAYRLWVKGEGFVFDDIPCQSEQKKCCLLVLSLNLKTPYGFMGPAIARLGEQYAAGRGYLQADTPRLLFFVGEECIFSLYLFMI